MMMMIGERIHGDSFKGYGWPATLELLSPASGKPVDSRQTIKLDICSSCHSIHEFNGICVSRHPSFPVKFHQPILKDQFNPFMRESIPPFLLDAYAEDHEAWGWIIP